MSKTIFVTPPGRIVQGNLSKPSTTDINNQPLVYKSGAQKGQPRVEYYFGLAISKQDPALQPFMQALGAAAQAGWPGGQATRPDFSWKMIDGDGVDTNGKPYSAREGHAGHLIFKFSGSFAPKCYVCNAPGSYVEVPPESVKTGDYVRVSGSAEGNGNPTNPGIYLNYDQIEHVGVGKEIVTGPSAADTFGKAAPVALPAGATAPATPAAAFASAPTPGYAAPAPAPAPAPAAAPMQYAPAPTPTAPPAPAPMAAPAPMQYAAPAAPAPAAPQYAAPAAPHPTFTQPPV